MDDHRVFGETTPPPVEPPKLKPKKSDKLKIELHKMKKPQYVNETPSSSFI
jgi:hypothetical protein